MLAAKGEKKAGATKTRRSRRGSGAAKPKADAPIAEAEVVEEVKATEVVAEAEVVEETPAAKAEDTTEEKKD